MIELGGRFEHSGRPHHARTPRAPTPLLGLARGRVVLEGAWPTAPTPKPPLPSLLLPLLLLTVAADLAAVAAIAGRCTGLGAAGRPAGRRRRRALLCPGLPSTGQPLSFSFWPEDS